MPRNLPLYNTLMARADEGALRFHMPGHKGKNIPKSPLAGACALDFTELYGTGNLYDGLWPIADAERLAASAWNVDQAFFLTGGASMGILSMLSIARQKTDCVLIDRGSHKSVYHGLGLMDFHPIYWMPEYLEPYGVVAPYSPQELNAILTRNPEIGAVLLTCPTYYGICSDIRSIAEVCHQHGAWLLVDEAHGAHFPFLEEKQSAVALGADLAVCSMHKTLPALGQAALLLAKSFFADYFIRRATSIFGTSSPSYQVMASMDLARDFMEEEGRRICAQHTKTLHKIRQDILSRGVFLPIDEPNMDPLRLCVMTSIAGISGYEAARILEENYHIVCEMADERQVLFIITAADTEQELLQLGEALFQLERWKSSPIQTVEPIRRCAKARYTPCEALRLPTQQVKLCDAEGCTAAMNLCPYPPGIPVVAVGEVIEADHLEYLYHNGFVQDDPILIIKAK